MSYSPSGIIITMVVTEAEPSKTPQPPPSNDYHPANAINNIRNEVHKILDREKSNHGSWIEIFKIHCHSCNVIDHIDPDSPRLTDVTSA